MRMIDIVFPTGNEEEFIILAERLGLSGLCFVYPGKVPALGIKTKLKMYSAGKNQGPLSVVGETEDCRSALESRSVDVVFGVENSKNQDPMKGRDSGLDQVLCSIASYKDKIIGFDFNSVLVSKGKKRSLLMGRMMQNIGLCRKYKVEMALCSFARKPVQLRNPADIAAFGEVLGMHPSEVKSALNVVESRINLNIKKAKGDYLGKGIERVE